MSNGIDFGTFDPTQLEITWGVTSVTGLADGEAISIEYDNDLYAKRQGIDGGMGRTFIPGNGAVGTFTLLQTSHMNDLFSAAFLLDSAISSVKILLPFMLRDGSGTTLAVASKSWLQKRPVLSYSFGEVASRIWMIEFADLISFVGGND